MITGVTEMLTNETLTKVFTDLYLGHKSVPNGNIGVACGTHFW